MPRGTATTMPTRQAKIRPGKPVMLNCSENTMPRRPEIQPMVMPMFRPMPHWMPGIMASTSTPYMVMRSSTLPSIMRTLML